MPFEVPNLLNPSESDTIYSFALTKNFYPGTKARLHESLDETCHHSQHNVQHVYEGQNAAQMIWDRQGKNI